MAWSYNVPPDLRRMLENVIYRRNVGPAEVWGEVRDWLEKEGIEAPARWSDGKPKPPPAEDG